MQPEVIEIGEVEDVIVGQEDEGRSNVRKMSKYFAQVDLIIFDRVTIGIGTTALVS